MGKHTEAFNKSFYDTKTEPTWEQAEAFCLKLSEKTTDIVIAMIVAKTKKKTTTTSEIMKYCKENDIQPDHDPYDNYGSEQTEINFDAPIVIDYAAMKEMEDVEIKNRGGFVVSNNLENKTIIIEFNDTEEMETINYGNDEK